MCSFDRFGDVLWTNYWREMYGPSFEMRIFILGESFEDRGKDFRLICVTGEGESGDSG